MAEGLLTALVVALALAIAGVIQLARNGSLSRRQMAALALLCAAGLLFMLITDWPTGLMAVFWAEHSVLSATLSSVLLVGLGFLVWERADQERQDALASGLSGAGFGAIVDHVIDVEVTLSLLSNPDPPQVAGWDEPGRPLRWLRAHRDHLTTGDDPRSVPVRIPSDEHDWRVELLDQAVRRTLGAMRDWSPLIDGSELGTTALLALSDIRKDCMELSSRLGRGLADERSIQILTTLRQRVRVLAYFFESFSGANPLRKEVRRSLDPLPPIGPSFTWAADSGSARFFNHHWRRALASTYEALNGEVTLAEIRDFVLRAHAGQVDKQGRNYYLHHLIPISEKLRIHGEHAEMAGLLHDVLEDTAVTVEDLDALGVPADVVRAVVSVSKQPGEAYDDLIARAAADPLGRLVKLADNAWNFDGLHDLAKTDPATAERLKTKYERARGMLEAAGDG